MNSKKWNWYLQDNAEREMKTSATHNTFGDDLRKKEIEVLFSPAVKSLNTPSPRVLDIGCGTCGYTTILKKLGFKTNGICLSIVDAAVCRDKNIDAAVCDMHEIEYPNNSFDAIFCAHTIEHSIAPYIAFCEFNRILKPDGILYISLPEPDSKWTFFPTHYSVLHPKQMLALAFRSGFKLIKFHKWRFNKETEHNQDSYVFVKEKNYKDVDRSYKPGDIFLDYNIRTVNDEN